MVNEFLAAHAPPVLDPFAGGGSIPLEAQRLGLRAYANDLNPIPVLINKALIEIPPKFADRPPVNPESRGEGSGKGKGKNALIEMDWPGATGLAEDVRYYGQWMRDEAKKRIGHLYPTVRVTEKIAKDRPDIREYVGRDMTVIAWLWARTAKCSNPGCKAAFPLMRSFALSTAKGKDLHLELDIDKHSNPPQFRFSVKSGNSKIRQGTVQKGAITCPVCLSSVTLEYLRSEAQSHRLGRIHIATVVEADAGRTYLSPLSEHESIANSAEPTWSPSEKVTTPCHDVDRLPMYGMHTWGDVFSKRQLVFLSTMCDLLNDAIATATQHCKSYSNTWTSDSQVKAYTDAIATYLAFAIGRQANYSSTLTAWGGSFIVQTFGRQALSMVWDYAEGNPFSNSTGNWLGAIEWICKCLETCVPAQGNAEATQKDATTAYEYAEPCIISTDPPYYDNIAYAELSDFFYVWLRRSIGSTYPGLFSTLLTPKAEELVAAPYRFGGSRDKAKRFFESGLVKSFTRMRAAQFSDVPLTVFYAFKQSESEEALHESMETHTGIASTGWETMLEGLFQSGFSIVGTWPVRTERDQGLKTGTNVLASSIVLVCRARPENAPLATRKEFIMTLRQHLPEALRGLQRGSIAPVDLAQSAIGPGMAVFTQYSKVMETDGAPMSIRMALGIINQVLDEVLAEQEGEFDSDTRWALSWFEQFGMKEEAFGVAETLSKAKNTAVNGLVEAGVIFAKSGKVRLLKREELPQDWDPATDRRLTVWESVQHLIRVLESQGETAAGDLVKKLGSQAETCRDLAYRLYSVCERKKWADEALAYNGLVIAWPELVRLSLASSVRPRETQAQLFS